jgi:hypothetical protein
MSVTPTNGATSTATMRMRYVPEVEVHALVGASDTFQLLCGIAGTLVGVSAAPAIALATGLQHPLAMEIILAAFCGGAVLAALSATFAYFNMRRIRTSAEAWTVEYLWQSTTTITGGGTPGVTVGGDPPTASRSARATQPPETSPD